MMLILGKRSGFCRQSLNCKKKMAAMFIIAIAVLFLCFAGTVMASSEEGGEAGHKVQEKGWVTTDTYRVMNFAVLVIGLFILLKKPVSQALNARIKGIKDQLDELEKKKRDAEVELSQFKEKLNRLEQEAEKLVGEYIRQGEEAKIRILQEAELTAKKLEDQAQRNIEHEFNQAKINLQEDIIEKALVKAEKLIKTKISTQDQNKLVDEFLDKVVA